MRRPGWCVAGLAAVTLGALPAGFAAETCRGVVPRPDGWVRIDAPPFVAGPPTLTGYAVAPFSARWPRYGGELLATNGRELDRSTDGGCSWAPVYTVAPFPGQDSAPLRSMSTEIVDVDLIGSGDFLGYRLYLLLQDRVAGRAAAVRVVVWDGYGEWSDVSSGLPPAATAVGLWGAPSGSGSAYLVLRDPAGRFSLYGTGNAAVRWTPRLGFADPAFEFLDLAVDSAEPAELWVGSTTGLHHSTDAGHTFVPVPGATGAVVEVATGNRFVPGRVLAFHSDGTVSDSPDGGASWQRRPAPPDVTSAAISLSGEHYGVSTATGVLVGTAGLFRDRTPRGSPDLRSVQFAWQGNHQLFAFDGSGIFWTYADPDPGSAYGPPGSGWTGPGTPWDSPARFPPLDLRRVSPRATGRPVLFPAQLRVDLARDQVRQVPYVLDLPRAPLDVMLVFDSTGSMEPLYAGLLRGLRQLVSDLAERRIDVQFGIADFQDYPTYPPGVGARYAYDRKRAVGPVDEELERAIAKIQPDGGTTDGKTSALAATYQAVTGAGQRRGPHVIPAGQDAGFRPDATPVVLLATDIEMRQPGARAPGYPGPARQEVIAALAERRVRFVGLDLTSPANQNWKPATDDLRAIAGGTATVAPAEGVDCDQDGTPDLTAGEPLVCKLTLADAEADLGPTMRALLRAVADPAPVSLEASAAAGVAAVVPPGRADAVDRTADNRLPFAVALACPAALAGGVLPVTLRASVRHVVVSTATAQVACALAPPPRPVPLAAFVPPPPAPPALTTNLNSNPQAGLAAAERRHAQAVLASAPREEDATNLAMSRRAEPDPSRTLLAAIALAGAAGGFALRRRTTTAPAVTRAR